MTTKVKGTEGVEFPDSTVQSSAAYTKAQSDARLIPAGAVMDFAMNAAPAGWLACDGAAVSRVTYAALFAAIGTTWGAGDGSTTFNLPDMRGYFRRGVGTNGDGTASGAFAVKQADDLKSHTHSYLSNTAGNSVTGGPTSISDSQSSNTTGATGGAETRPKNIAVLTCISTGV